MYNSILQRNQTKQHIFIPTTHKEEENFLVLTLLFKMVMIEQSIGFASGEFECHCVDEMKCGILTIIGSHKLFEMMLQSCFQNNFQVISRIHFITWIDENDWTAFIGKPLRVVVRNCDQLNKYGNFESL